MIRGGQSYVCSAPALSNDGKRLLVCTANTVSVFSTSTGLQVSALEGHAAPVTSVIVVPPPNQAAKTLCYCWTSSLDGTIRYWDFSVPELIKMLDFQFPIFSMVIPSILCPPEENSAKTPNVFAYVSVQDMNSQYNRHKAFCAQIRKFNLTTLERLATSS